jgi:hypothetical protein
MLAKLAEELSPKTVQSLLNFLDGIFAFLDQAPVGHREPRRAGRPPRELLGLRWQDIDWTASRVRRR